MSDCTSVCVWGGALCEKVTVWTCQKQFRGRCACVFEIASCFVCMIVALVKECVCLTLNVNVSCEYYIQMTLYLAVCMLSSWFASPLWCLRNVPLYVGMYLYPSVWLLLWVSSCVRLKIFMSILFDCRFVCISKYSCFGFICLSLSWWMYRN